MKSFFHHRPFSFLPNLTLVLSFTLLLGASMNANGQSPKKLLENGFYERAYKRAAYKQNKKVKLKSKFTTVIYESYDKIYESHGKLVKSTETDWQISYNNFLRLFNFRALVKHPGVFENLDNPVLDKKLLDILGRKFNEDNQRNLAAGKTFEEESKYEKAIEQYKMIEKRHKDALNISTLKDRTELIDHEELIQNVKQKIGDRYIQEARVLLEGTSEENAIEAKKLIEKARRQRPLRRDEEELLKLADLLKGESWLIEAKKLLETRTKNNARLAYELMARARTISPLTPEEEKLSETAKDIGTTRILVNVLGDEPIHSDKELSGFLNKVKASKWEVFYFENDPALSYDFEMDITESQPIVVLEKTDKNITQNTRTVEYWEEQSDGQGGTEQVKKTRVAVGIFIVLSRTKWSNVNWSVVVKDLTDGNAAFSETRDSKVEVTNKFVSLESGDILAQPEDIESEVGLDSQPFPSDAKMLTSAKEKYQNDLRNLLIAWELHSHNVNIVIGE